MFASIEHSDRHRNNGTLAITIAVLLFGGGLATVPAATYSLTMFVTALIYVAVLRRAQGALQP